MTQHFGQGKQLLSYYCNLQQYHKTYIFTVNTHHWNYKVTRHVGNGPYLCTTTMIYLMPSLSIQTSKLYGIQDQPHLMRSHLGPDISLRIAQNLIPVQSISQRHAEMSTYNKKLQRSTTVTFLYSLVEDIWKIKTFCLYLFATIMQH